jgi:hypothetical protein
MVDPGFICCSILEQEGLSFGFNMEEMAFISVLGLSVVGQENNTGQPA